MKRAIVLGGGGSCGAFQLGAWQALQEAGRAFDGFYGTSIGSINAALMAQGDIALAAQLWDNITVDQVMADGFNMDMNMQALLGRKRELMAFLRGYAQHGGADIGPLVSLCRRVIDEGRIRAGGRRLGLVTVRFPSLTPVLKRLPEMREGTLVDWLMASAACFPAFPMWQMDGASFIDGGYYDNLPVGMALLDGAEDIVAVDLRVRPSHPRAMNEPYVLYVKPSWHLGSILMFDQAVIQRNKRMGYLDTMKALGRLDGIRYAFRPLDRERLFPAARRFSLMVGRVEAGIAGRGPRGIGAAHPLSEVVEETTEGRRLDDVSRLLRGGELCAQLLGVEAVALYDEEELYRQMRARVEAEPAVWDAKAPAKFLAACPPDRRSAAVACLWQAIRERPSFGEQELRELCAWPHELAAAIYLTARERAGTGRGE